VPTLTHRAIEFFYDRLLLWMGSAELHPAGTAA
jgi:hypothetical protein